MQQTASCKRRLKIIQNITKIFTPMASTFFSTRPRATRPKNGHLSLSQTHTCTFTTKTTSHG